jgi:enamine deaminase RidA (YjgF/YER057c/UK114 family)
MRRRLILITTVVALGTVFAAASWSQSPDSGAKPAGKRVHRRAGAASQNKVPLFNEAVSYGNLLFIAGKGAGRDFQGDITAHTKQALDRLEEALKNAGSSMEKVLKVNVYLKNPEDFEGMNKAYQGRFGAEPPVRTTISGVRIPDGSLVEIDCIAYF